LALDSDAYRYADNGPTDGTDPSGLAEEKLRVNLGKFANLKPGKSYYAQELIAIGRDFYRQWGDLAVLVYDDTISRYDFAYIQYGIELEMKARQNKGMLPAGGYADEFGWHRSFCASCHDPIDRGAQLKMAAAMNGWDVFAAREVPPLVLSAAIPLLTEGRFASRAVQGLQPNVALAAPGPVPELKPNVALAAPEPVPGLTPNVATAAPEVVSGLTPNVVTTTGVTLQSARGSMGVIDLAAAKQLAPKNPSGLITLYHGTNDSGAVNLLNKGIVATSGGGDSFPVTTIPKTAIGYAEKVSRLYGGSPRVVTIEMPYEELSNLFKSKLIEPHGVLPDSYNITVKGAEVVNRILGLPK
jgi:hypothetical protein